MFADGFVVGAGSRLIEKGAYARPCYGVIGAIHGEAVSDIAEEPVVAFPVAGYGGFAPLVGKAGDLAMVGPVIKVRAVGIMGGGAVGFVLIPQAPGAVRQMQDARINVLVVLKRQGGNVIPIDQILAGKVNDIARVAP